MSFGERLREARKKAGYTQKELAKKLNVSYQQIGQYESNIRNPKKETLAKIADALQLGYSYTKDGEPYFYDFVDTVHHSEDTENEEFNNMQYADAQRIMKPFNRLNAPGQEKVVEYAEDLTKIPEYQKKDE